MPLHLSFHGAAGTVTGSRHLLATPGARILIDAGLFQGLKELRLLNWRDPPFPAASLDHVLLTHAHIDHSGALPRLVKNGYRGPIHCTRATEELAELLLPDSARLQEEDAEYANRKGYSLHRPALPLYTVADAERALARFQPTDLAEWIQLGPGTRARFHNAGHILGSGVVEVLAEHDGQTSSIVFSGDIGRYGVPLHSDPAPPPPCDVLVVESTYGDRQHDHAPVEEQVGRLLRETLGHGKTVLVPSFAVGRAQVLTLILHELMSRGELPEVPIHIDSPMAVDATRIYRRYLRDPGLDDELHTGRSPLFPGNVRYHRSVAESRSLNDLAGPRIIISPSGMLAGGRVLHHLARLAGDPGNLVVLVGYQAAGTRGRKLLESGGSVRVHGRDVAVRARVASITGLSAHADADELLRWVRSAGTRPKAVFVTHGEPDAARALARRLEKELDLRTFVPALDDGFDLLPLVTSRG